MRYVRQKLPQYFLLTGLLWMSAAFPAPAAPAAKKVEPVCDGTAFRVALDVGHTPEEPGAISALGVAEYEFNLNLARRIERSLLDAGVAKTIVLLTSGLKQRGLVKRVLDANGAKADLLISIHHDSVPENLLQHMDEEGGPKRFSDRFKGHSIFVSFDNVDFSGSLQFAKLLGQKMKANGLQFTPHYTDKIMGSRRRDLVDKDVGVYRFDALYVLRASRMPAVLLEAGMIINPTEEKILAGQERPKQIANAVKEAVTAFCAARAPLPPKPAAAKRS